MQNHLTNLLTNLTIAFRNKSQNLLSNAGIPSGQSQVLTVLWQREGLTQADISKELAISAPTANILISKLEKAGFVKYKNCPKDKRLRRVYLTKKGCEIRSEVEKQLNELESLILSGFSDTEKILILMLLEKIKNNLQI